MSSIPQLRQKDFFLLITAVLAATGAAITSWISPHVAFLAVYLFVSTFCTVTAGLRCPVIWGAAFLINFFAALSSAFPTGMQGTEERFMSIIFGFAIAIILQKGFFPNRLRYDARLALTQALQDLLELNKAIFNCFLAVDYPEKQFFYAQVLHQTRRDYSFSITVARNLINKIKKRPEKLSKILFDIEELGEIIQSVGTVTDRVEDHTTFQIVFKELLAIGENIYSELRAIKIYLLKKSSVPTVSDTLKENIFQLEDVNHSAVNVAAKDPMVFLLLAQDLFALQNALGNLTADVTAAVGDK